MSLTIEKIREIVQGNALPGSLSCVQDTCRNRDGLGVDRCSCRKILQAMGIEVPEDRPVTPGQRVFAGGCVVAANEPEEPAPCACGGNCP